MGQNTSENPKASAQLVGNMGLYAVCWQLAKRGWNVMPTSRNAKGIDILGYDQTGKRTITVQVKALSKRNPVPLGAEPKNLIATFIILVELARRSDVGDDEPMAAGLTFFFFSPALLTAAILLLASTGKRRSQHQPARAPAPKSDGSS